MQLDRALMAASAGISLAFGAIHLLYTFHGPKLLPRDPAVQAAMQGTHLVLTQETTVWRAWIGFNATHSMALILFGVIFGFLALSHGQVLFGSPLLLVIGFATLLAFFVLARLYFFSIAFAGVSLALALYAASVFIARA